jgi:hypothetical protein
MIYEKGIWAAAEISGIISLICFCYKKDDKGNVIANSFYWGQSASWSVFSNKDKILKVYGKIPSEKQDKLELEYIKEFHPITISKPKVSSGWIAPNGNFYSCRSQEHDSLAKHLSAIWYDDINSPVDRLEKEGWIRLFDDGMIICWDGFKDPAIATSDEQQETIWKLSSIGNKAWNNRVSYYLRQETLDKHNM